MCVFLFGAQQHSQGGVAKGLVYTFIKTGVKGAIIGGYHRPVG